jgi:predicted dehydrogenase
MSRINRRRFLEDSFFAASVAAMAASGLFDDAAHAQPLIPRRRVGQNDKVQVAVIGVKSRGMGHVESLLRLPDVEVVAICDVDQNMSARAMKAVEAKNGKAPKYYQDLRKLYEDKDVEAVSMALPIHWHALASIWAMQAGKDVYVEKPVSHNVAEGRRMVEAAARYNKICQSGTQSRSSKATQDAVKYIHDGKIGKVSLARGLCYKPRKSIGIKPDSPVPAGVDYNVWLGPAPERPFNPNRFHYEWHWMWDYGAGDLGNQGIHQMDIARWALNEHELPERVVAVGGRYGYVDQGETPNTVVSWYDYGDKQLIFEVRGLPTERYQTVDIGDIVYGSDGYVVFTSNYGRAAAFDKDGNAKEAFSGGGNHHANFIEAVKSRKVSDLNAPVLEGHLSSALCHLGNVSYRLGEKATFKDRKPFPTKEGEEAFARLETHLKDNMVATDSAPLQMGRMLTLDPKKEGCRNDREAEAMMTRVYRAPFVVPAKI